MKVPMRLCASCRQLKLKKDLIRVVRTPDGQVVIDCRHRMNGRGAYICNDSECVNAAVKKHSIERSLGMQIPEEIYSDMRKMVNEQTR